MEKILKLGLNKLGRDLVVGDIHGCVKLLKKLLWKAGFDPAKDRLISVGDLVDRGSECVEAVRLIDEPWFFAVKGNHEELLLSAFGIGAGIAVHLVNGGGWFWEIEEDSVQEEIYVKLRDLPIAIEIETPDGKIGVVHAECPYDSWDDFVKHVTADTAEAEHAKEMALWARRKVKGKDSRLTLGVHKVICGHTILRDWSSVGNHMFIDTGGFNFGKMTMYDTKHHEIYQVDGND